MFKLVTICSSLLSSMCVAGPWVPLQEGTCLGQESDSHENTLFIICPSVERAALFTNECDEVSTFKINGRTQKNYTTKRFKSNWVFSGNLIEVLLHTSTSALIVIECKNNKKFFFTGDLAEKS